MTDVLEGLYLLDIRILLVPVGIVVLLGFLWLVVTFARSMDQMDRER